MQFTLGIGFGCCRHRQDPLPKHLDRNSQKQGGIHAAGEGDDRTFETGQNPFQMFKFVRQLRIDSIVHIPVPSSSDNLASGPCAPFEDQDTDPFRSAIEFK